MTHYSVPQYLRNTTEAIDRVMEREKCSMPEAAHIAHREILLDALDKAITLDEVRDILRALIVYPVG